MATGATYNDREFLFRLETQIIDGGTDVLRNIFDQKLPNMPLNVFLANEKAFIKRLQAQKTITKTQYNILYPTGGQLPNIANFDITLIICLLRNLKHFGLSPTFLWNAAPQQTDTSLEADLCRLKGFRNEIAHISSTTGFQQASFLTKWTEIEQVLLRLNSAVPNPVPDLKQNLDSYKYCPLEPAAEQRIQADIENWQGMEKALEVETKLITEDVKTLQKDVTYVSKDVKVGFEKVTNDVREVKGSVEKMTENIRKLERQVKVTEGKELIKEDVKGLQKDVYDVSKDVKEGFKKVTDNAETVKGSVESMTENIRKLEERVKVNVEKELIKEDVKGLQKDVNNVSKDVKEVITRFEKVNIDVGEVKNSVETMNENIRKLEEQLKVKGSDGKEAKIQDLQDDLVAFYRDEHRTISLSPLIEETTPLLKFYVMPDIYSLKLQRTSSGVKQEKTAVTPLRNVFYNDNKMCRKIYLTADAGLGKTALSKRLTLAWCHAHKPHENDAQYFSKEEIQAVNGFRYVFLLLLRNSSSECDIDDLIWNQIISQLAHDYTREDLVNILCKEICLVILDGLDEWSHPSNSCKQGSSPIPHRKARERTAVLTTTIPWKLSVSGLQSSQIDQKLEILGLNQKSTDALKKSVISHLLPEINEWTLENHVAEFTRAVAEKQNSDLEAIPLLLMYLLFLWCNKIEQGQSQTDLYCQITELLLSRTVQKYKELSLKVDVPKGEIPQFFSDKINCSHFYTLLTVLGQLAYQTLLNETREENTLVFDSCVAYKYLNKECLNFCLKTGLITQSKVPGTLLEHKSKVSFAHKTVQEFFAALYMLSTSDQRSVSEIVLSKCNCMKDILEMSKILKFSCGMNVNVLSLISREMVKIINEDEITREYRSSLKSCTFLFGFSHPLKDFQNMCISCCKEIPLENEISLCLQDVFIERSCMQEQYCENLKQLTTKNKQNIRTIYIDMDDMRETPYSSAQKVIANFGLNGLETIEKIHYEGKYNDSDILPLLNRSVKCLYLSCSFLCSWSRLLCEKVTNLQKLEAIHIRWFKMSHSELTLLYDYISKRHCMRQIELVVLRCTDHWLSCTGYSLDLSQHSELHTLTLYRIPVSELNINMASLEECRLWRLSDPDLVLRFINCVPANSKLNTFECRVLKSSVAIETMLELLHLSVRVKHVDLRWINLGNREVLTSEMVKIEDVHLEEVTITASALQRIVDVVQQQPQTVSVAIRGCDIKPESEFATVKQNTKTSREHFRVLEDSEDKFKFETIKQGN